MSSLSKINMYQQTPIKVVFQKRFAPEILRVLGKKTEEITNRIIDANTNEPVETPEGFEVTLKELGAIKIGSQIFYKNDVVSVLKLYEALENNGTSDS